MLRTLLFTLLLLAPFTSHATDWTMQAADSTLGFQGSYEGDVFNGVFKRFDATIRYNPDDLASARFDVTVDLASVDTQSSDRDDTLADADFFNTKVFPKAHFVTESFSRADDGKVYAQGALTIRDQTRPVRLLVEFSADGDQATLGVSTTLKRAEFDLGASTDWSAISSDISVRGKLRLHAGP